MTAVVIVSPPCPSPSWGGWTMRSIGRVGLCDATTMVAGRHRTASDSPTLTAARSVPPHEGEGGLRLDFRWVAWEAFDLGAL